MLYALFFIVAIAAFGLSAVCGGGASFILLPFLDVILPADQVPAAMSVESAASSVSRLFIFKKHIRWDIVLRFVPPALPEVWLGAKLLSSINPVWLELVIGLFLIINLPFIFKKDAPSSKKRSKWILPASSIQTLRTKENAKLWFTWVEQGMEAQLATKQQRYAIESSLSEGIELERTIKFTDLHFAKNNRFPNLR